MVKVLRVLVHHRGCGVSITRGRLQLLNSDYKAV